MGIRTIIQPDNPTLRTKAKRVREFDKKLHKLLDDMLDTLNDASGVGLAAPQVAVSQRAILVRLPDDEHSHEEFGDLAGVLYEMINPEIVKSSRESVEGIEGCLSIPGYFGLVERSEAVTVQGQDRNGKPMRVKAYDWLAQSFRHEIDHLDGVLYIDKAIEVWKGRRGTAIHTGNVSRSRRWRLHRAGDYRRPVRLITGSVFDERRFLLL